MWHAPALQSSGSTDANAVAHVHTVRRPASFAVRARSGHVDATYSDVAAHFLKVLRHTNGWCDCQDESIREEGKRTH